MEVMINISYSEDICNKTLGIQGVGLVLSNNSLLNITVVSMRRVNEIHCLSQH